MANPKQPKNDLNRCPFCGATDVTLDPATGQLKCHFCRAVFDPQFVDTTSDLRQLQGEIIGSGATQIIPDTKNVLTFKCAACGAEIVVDTAESTSARCHWCRHHLSVNETIPNGAVPDMVLPFKMAKNNAETNIQDFVHKRQFFAHPKFKEEFTTKNVMGVYLPYMVVDINSHVALAGQAEHLVRSYTRGSGDSRTTYYDADLYNVSRDFDLLIDGLTIEASKDKLHQNTLINTNNIINSIMPFDTEHCVAWDANYLRGFASEKRDTDVADLRNQLTLQARDVARYKANETIQFYNRGAKWQTEKFDVKGVHWQSAYLPIWLYSYMEEDNGKKLLHYVAVNARTGETMGSVPIYKQKLLGFSALIELIGIILGIAWFLSFIGMDIEEDNPALAGLIGLTPGFIYYWWITNRYRNMSARHYHEAETKATPENLKSSDIFVEHRKGLKNSRIEGMNNNIVSGVVSGGAKKMMGEKMAAAIGIGKMKGTPNINNTNSSPDEVAKKSRNGIVIAIIVIFATIFIFMGIIGAVISSFDGYSYYQDYDYDYSHDDYDYNYNYKDYGGV
ncbi:MAG: TFIIB-type zinc ribbon-containing protein [Candidatus Nomurabacteria bacterium]|jgi:DNA-directed RNA polymerase subunit RPC12/RpoP|nr:TFIIB-type zinc ribbon-containing protein [Candidatus Nomurabacteria bacterium]